MIISDLNHIEVVAQENQVEGGFCFYWNPCFVCPTADAGALASANAFGKSTSAYTMTGTTAVAGFMSSSGSSSTASASGY